MKNLIEELMEMMRQNTANLKATADNIDAINRKLTHFCDNANYSVMPFRVDFYGQATILKDIKGRMSST